MRGGCIVIRLTVNGRAVEVEAAPDTPLLWVLRDHLGLVGTRFGCGAGMCGACTVHLDGVATFSCLTAVEDAAHQQITTIEGLSPDGSHPVQRAWVAEQTPQCGYCQSGQIMRAAALLAANPTPSRDEIVGEMSANLCRCGTYPRIIRAIERAAREG
nr:(2Fe-2S)-binding protein [Thalassobaculum salexigens]